MKLVLYYTFKGAWFLIVLLVIGLAGNFLREWWATPEGFVDFTISAILIIILFLGLIGLGYTTHKMIELIRE